MLLVARGLVLALILAVGAYAIATKAFGHSFYPPHCCADSDCGPAITAVRNLDGSLTVTTKHGTATFPRDFKYEPSPDGVIHACFTPNKLYCLYLSVGI